jgi:hypothetical protein
VKLSVKRVMFNRYVYSAIFAFFLIAFASWLLHSHVLNIAFMDTNAPDIKGHGDQVKATLMQGIFVLSGYMVDVFFATITFIPFLSALFCMNFLTEKEGFYKFAYFRMTNYKKYIRKRILIHLLYSAAVMYIVYVIILLIGMLVCQIKINPQDGTGMITSFDDIIGNQKTPQLLVMRYFLDGILKCVVAPICFGLLAISISFLTDKKYLPLIIPLAYYVLCTAFIDSLHLSYLSPHLTIAFTSFTPIKSQRIYSYDALIPMLPLLFFSITVIEYKLRRGERLGS